MQTDMEKKMRNRCVMGLAILLGLLAVFLLLSICIGSVSVSPQEVLAVLQGKAGLDTARDIVLSIRLPRALAALFLGGALALSGYLLQSFFHNPIAGPFVLGISSGAKLCVALVMVALLNFRKTAGSMALILAAFVGALASMGFVLLLARKVEQMSMLVVGGVMIGYICSAVTDFVVTFADDANIVNLHNLVQGQFFRHRLAFGGLDHGAGAGGIAGDVSPVETFAGVPAGRSLCPQYGCQLKNLPGVAGDPVQSAGGLRDGVRRAGVLCGHCGAPSGQSTFEKRRSSLDDPVLFPGGRGVLSGL